MGASAPEQWRVQVTASVELSVVDNEHSGGSAALRGYDYQRDVSVWAALQLLLPGADGPAAAELVIEPVSAEDLEVALGAPGEEPTPGVQVEGRTRLTIQVKYRDTGSWSAAQFRKLVEDRVKQGTRGPEPRERAQSQLLRDQSLRYLLITNQGVDADLAPIRVESLTAQPAGGALPDGMTLRPAEERALAGRFAVLPSLVPQLLDAEIRTLLATRGHVPAGRIERAVDRLRRAVEDRMRGLAAALTRAGVESIVRVAGGLPVPDRELAEYRLPLALQTAEQRLASDHAVLLVGPPGYGKSLTARWLVHRLRNEVPAFDEVNAGEGIAAVERALGTPGRSVIYLDDPWGNAGLSGEAQAWAVALPKLLWRATPDKVFVITSRSDIYRRALGARPEPIWDRIACVLDADSYPDETRWAILLGKVRQEGGWRADLMDAHRGSLLRRLKSPLALDRFAQLLGRCPSPAAADVDRLIEDAQVESIRRVVEEQVKGWPEGVHHATVLWAMLRGARGIEPLQLRRLQLRLEEDAVPGYLDLEAFVEHFQPGTFELGSDIRVGAHSMVIEGLEALVTFHRGSARPMLDRTARALDDLRREDPAFLPLLLGLVDATAAVAGSGVQLSPSTRALVDQRVLETLLSAGEGEVESAIRSLIRRASDAVAAARLARYLDRGEADRDGGRPDWIWKAPKVAAEEIAAIRADPASARLVAAWVTYVLPDARSYYGTDALLAWLAPFGFALDGAFLDACERMLDILEFFHNSTTVVEGALAGQEPPFDRVFALIEEMDKRIEARQRLRGPEGNPWQAELDYAHQLHLQDRFEEEHAIVKTAVEGYVRARRRREGYGWFADHGRPDLILSAWAAAMEDGDPEPTAEELDAFFATAGDDDELRAKGLRVIGSRRVVAAVPRLTAALHSGTPEQRRGAVDAFNWLRAQASAITDLVLAAMEGLSEGEQVDVLLAAARFDRWPGEGPAVVDLVMERAPDGMQAIFRFASLVHGNTPREDLLVAFRRIPPEQVDRLLETAPLPVAGPLLSCASQEGRDVAAVAERWLLWDEVDAVGFAVEALALVSTPDARAMVARALEHGDYRVRRFALVELAQGASDDERRRILALAGDPSAEVLHALAESINENGWEEGIPLLVRLLRHQRNYARHPETRHEAPYQFKVARAAATALGRFSGLDPEVVGELMAFVREGDAASRDVEVHASVLPVLASTDDPEVPSLLSRMLRDARVLNISCEPLYPVRYAAAWALVTVQGKMPGDGIAWGEVARCASHHDAQLAAPCLLLLGRRLQTEPNPEPEVIEGLRVPEMTDARRSLALLAMSTPADAARVSARFGILPADHPLLVPSVARPDGALTAEWSASATLEAWLHGLRMDQDVEGVLRWLAEIRFGLDLQTGDFKPKQLRWSKPDVPLTSVSEMFGME